MPTVIAKALLAREADRVGDGVEGECLLEEASFASDGVFGFASDQSAVPAAAGRSMVVSGIMS